MSKLFFFTSLSILVAISMIVTGCSKQQASQQPSASPTVTGHEGHEHGEAGDAKHSAHAMHSEHKDALAELSPEDRALAEKQKTCPVSGEPLGAMGKPYKVTIQGRDVLLCCPGCEAEIKENPEKYLAKLRK